MDKRTWLLVEDDASLRDMLKTMLEVIWENLTILAFKDGFEAMGWLDKVQAGLVGAPLPELALLDIRMPGPQGHEIAQRLRQMDATADTAIVMMTAFRFDGEERARINQMANPDLFINKPVPAPLELKSLFDKVLAGR